MAEPEQNGPDSCCVLGRALASTEPAPALEIGGGCGAMGEVQVLVINTGGTIGMVPQSEGERLGSGDWSGLAKQRARL